MSCAALLLSLHAWAVCDYVAYFHGHHTEAERLLARGMLTGPARGAVMQLVAEGSEWQLGERGYVHIDTLTEAMRQHYSHATSRPQATSGWMACVNQQHSGAGYLLTATLRHRYASTANEPVGLRVDGNENVVFHLTQRVGEAYAPSHTLGESLLASRLFLTLTLDGEAQATEAKSLASYVSYYGSASTPPRSKILQHGLLMRAQDFNTTPDATPAHNPVHTREDPTPRKSPPQQGGTPPRQAPTQPAAQQQKPTQPERQAMRLRFVLMAQGCGAVALGLASALLYFRSNDAPADDTGGKWGANTFTETGDRILADVSGYDKALYAITAAVVADCVLMALFQVSLLEGILRSCCAFALCYIGYSLDRRKVFTPAYLAIVAGFIMWAGNPRY